MNKLKIHKFTNDKTVEWDLDLDNGIAVSSIGKINILNSKFINENYKKIPYLKIINVPKTEIYYQVYDDCGLISEHTINSYIKSGWDEFDNKLKEIIDSLPFE